MICRLTLILVLAILTATLFGCSSSESSGDKPDTAASGSDRTVKQAETNPKPSSTTTNAGSDFSGLYAYDAHGQRHQMSEWLGTKPTVINFWGTWCPPCRREIPDLIKLYDEYKSQGVEIVSIAVKDRPEQVVNFARDAGMGWIMLMFDPQHAQTFKLTGSVPTTIFYDRNGVEVGRFVGARPYDVFKPAFERITM